MLCQAIVEDWEHLSYFAGPQRITCPGHKPCSREAKGVVKHLHLCTTHIRMAREGLVDARGHVAPKSMIRDVRRYPKKFPRGLYTWAAS